MATTTTTIVHTAPVIIIVATPVIHFVHNGIERREIRVNGEFFGDAVENEFGGWNVFEGRFPSARRFPQADGCTLDEVRRELTKALAY